MCEYCTNPKNRKPLVSKLPELNPIYGKNNVEGLEVEIKGTQLSIFMYKDSYYPDELDFDGDFGVFKTDIELRKRIKINYCPMCGRKLTK